MPFIFTCAKKNFRFGSLRLGLVMLQEPQDLFLALSETKQKMKQCNLLININILNVAEIFDIQSSLLCKFVILIAPACYGLLR